MKNSGREATDFKEQVNKFTAYLVETFPDVGSASGDVLPLESGSLVDKPSLVPGIFSPI